MASAASQKALSEFSEALALEQSALLLHGAEKCFAKFGPVVQADKLLLLPCVIVNADRSARVPDWLDKRWNLPHLTLGVCSAG